jgi:hypothetical protein
VWAALASALALFGVALAGNANAAVTGGPAAGGEPGLLGAARFFSEPTGPTATTEPASAVSASSATLNASVNPNGVEVTSCELQYDNRPGYELAGEVPCSPEPGSGNSPVSVSATVKGLSAESAYHFRVVVKSAGGTVFGSDETFTTLAAKPTVVTEAATSVTKAGAKLNATVNPNGAAVTSCQFEYGTTEAYGHTGACSPPPGSGTSPVAVSSTIGGLTPSTTYHFRISGTGAGGTNQGSDETFKTLEEAPSFGSFGFTEEEKLRSTTVTMRIGVNPHGGLVTDCHFEYGTTPEPPYGSSVACEPMPGSGESEVQVKAKLTGLTPNTKYYGRMVATNAGGSGFSNRATILTPELIGEFGRCVKGVAPARPFKTAACTSELSTGKYEFLPGLPANRAVSLPVKPATKVTFEDANKDRVTCSGGTGGGEITAQQVISAITITLTGCEDATKPCQTAGHASGEVVLAGLSGEIGVLSYTTANFGDKLGLKLSGEASFECGGGSIAVSLAGNAIGSLSPADTMTATRSLKWTQLKGVQKPEAFAELAAPPPLEWTMTGFGSPLRVGLSMTLQLITAEKIEINTVV